MDRICIQGGRVVLPNEIIQGNIIAENGVIQGFSSETPEECLVINAEGLLVTPGFVETHVHGGGGADFMDGTGSAFGQAIMTHVRHGATTICPTTMSCSLTQLLSVFDAYREAEKTEAGAHMFGLNLEGPFLNPEMCGAQKAGFIRPPSRQETDIIFTAGGDIISRISCAPELDGIAYLAKRATEMEIMLSIAHSAATAQQMYTALELGFHHVTHLYSGTTGIRKINQRIYAGIQEAAYLYDDCFIELIGDGRHVAKETMQLAVKIKGAGHINLTGDSMRAAGEDDAQESYLGNICPENRVIIEDDVAKLPDRSSYAGSIATVDRIFQNAVLNYDISVINAVEMLSATPARLIGAKTKGSMEPGKDCDAVLWDSNLNITGLFFRGRRIV